MRHSWWLKGKTECLQNLSKLMCGFSSSSKTTWEKREDHELGLQLPLILPLVRTWLSFTEVTSVSTQTFPVFPSHTGSPQPHGTGPQNKLFFPTLENSHCQSGGRTRRNLGLVSIAVPRTVLWNPFGEAKPSLIPKSLGFFSSAHVLGCLWLLSATEVRMGMQSI